MTKAPVLPRPVRGCSVCTSFLKRRATLSLVDIYVQHHRIVHSFMTSDDATSEREKTYEWFYGIACV